MDSQHNDNAWIGMASSGFCKSSNPFSLLQNFPGSGIRLEAHQEKPMLTAWHILTVIGSYVIHIKHS